MILVTGATGNVGGQLLTLLGARGTPSRALVRSKERADTLRGYDCEVVVGDFADPDSLDAALARVERVFLVSPYGPDTPRLEAAVVEAALRARQRFDVSVHVVKLSVLGAAEDSDVRLLRNHARSARQLQESGLPWTLLEPNSFLQNWLAGAAAVQATGALPSVTGEGAASYIDVRDVAAVAAHVLTSADHAGQRYVLTGPQPLTGTDLAAALATAIGRPVRAAQATSAEYAAWLRTAGMSDWQVETLVELQTAIAYGKFASVTDDVQHVTGRPARTAETFFRDHRAAFA
jgi:uncharacterized protein YbjT (DUF2867 family)